MNRGSWLGLCLFGTACTTTTTVAPHSLSQLNQGDGAVVVKSVTGKSVRLDPNTAIRFRLQNGALTPWYALSDFKATNEGLFLPYKTKMKDSLQAEGYGLDAHDIDRLRSVVDDPKAMVVTYEKVVLTAPGRHLSEWVKAASVESGRWTLLTDVGVFGPEIDAMRLARVANGAPYEVDLGVRFEKLHEAEVKNLSGGKSLALVAGSAAVVAAVVLMAKSGGGGGGGGGISGDGAGNIYVHPVEVALYATDVSIRSMAALHTIHYMSDAPQMIHQRRQDVEDETLGFDSPAAGQAESVFDGVERRRATFAIVPSYEAGPSSFTSRSEFSHTAALSFRIKEFTELGAAFTQDVGRSSKDNLQSSLTVSGLLGLHLPLDVHHRVAASVGARVGAGSRDQLRVGMRYGLRIRILEQASIGVFPFNARWRRLKRQDSPEGWDFPSSIELSWAF